MGTPFLGEVKIVSFNFAPRGWAFCNGQLLPINQNQALFSILGTTYGGNGQTNFALPNLQGRVPVHVGQGIFLGQSSGEQAHTLTQSEMPAHTHLPNANSGDANKGPAANNFWSKTGSYAATPNNTMNPAGITPTGGSQPHDNMTPYLTVNFIIALQGIFPSRN
jgi:microcystin-dependent protein